MQQGKVALGVYPTSTVKDVAESLGVDKLPDDVARAVANDTEYRLNLVIQEAQKFMRHAHRSSLTPADIDHALEVLNVAPLLHPPPALAKPTFVPVYSNIQSNSSSQQLYYLKDEEIDLSNYLKSARNIPVEVPIGEAGQGVRWKAHWLAVEGVQPLIKENPAPLPGESGLPTPPVSTTDQTNSTSKLLAKQVLSKEIQILFERLTSALVPDPNEYNPFFKSVPAPPTATENAIAGPSSVPAAPATSTIETVNPEITAEVQTSLSLLEQGRLAALTTLSSDPGLVDLVPYLIRWMTEGINTTISASLPGGGKSGLDVGRDVDQKEKRVGRMGRAVLGWLIEGLDALTRNEALFIEPYLHQFLAPIMSILLCTSLGPLAASSSSTNNAILANQAPGLAQSSTATDVRKLAADLLGKLISVYGKAYESLLPRIVKTLVRALQTTPVSSVSTRSSQSRTTTLPSESPVAGRYEGAILALRSIGEQAVLAGIVSEQDGGIGLKSFGEVLDRFDAGDKMALVEMTLATLKWALDIPPTGDDMMVDGDDQMGELQPKYGQLFGGALARENGLVAKLA